MERLLSKEDILRADDSEYIIEDVPEWGGSIRINAMSLKETLEFERLQGDNSEKEGSRVDQKQLLYILSKSIRDASGSPMFSEEEAMVLLQKNSKVVQRIFMKCAEINKVTVPEIKALEKN